ncbi:MAG: hypothetical protein NT051_00880 [Candidatus Micrarchaeota archaeon]|nr:hypothetical protein [Candidatus Micrarchaeota archaeon]
MPILPISIIIRKPQKQEEESLFEIMQSLFPNSRVKHKRGDIYLVAEIDGKLAGFCHYRMRKLLSRALDEIDSAGMQTTLLKVRALNPASNLYVKFGFFEKYSSETLLLVRKRPS